MRQATNEELLQTIRNGQRWGRMLRDVVADPGAYARIVEDLAALGAPAERAHADVWRRARELEQRTR